MGQVNITDQTVLTPLTFLYKPKGVTKLRFVTRIKCLTKPKVLFGVFVKRSDVRLTSLWDVSDVKR